MAMREWYREAKLAEIAKAASMESWYRRDGASHTPSEEERKIFYNIFFGALLTLNYGEAVRIVDSEKAQAVCDCIEFQMNLFCPGYNWYDSVYNPLKRVLADWKTEQC